MNMLASQLRSDHDILRLTSMIVSAYISNNTVPATQIAALIEAVQTSLRRLKAGEMSAEETNDLKKPAVPIKKSITPDFLICLEDGRKLKMLKRHLRTTYDMSPEEYRAKWGLPSDYPMVAPNYAKLRSEFAKNSGLGRAAKPG